MDPFSSLYTHYGNQQEGLKKFVRSGIRTHAFRRRLRPERSALDRSAILTIVLLNAMPFKKIYKKEKKCVTFKWLAMRT